MGVLPAITGSVVADADGDGVRDPGESGIPGVLVTMDAAISAETAADGSYVFTTTVPGLHTIVETDPVWYASTTPNTVTLDVQLGLIYLVNFGDIAPAPCACLADGYEEDDTAAEARDITPGATQARSFCDDATDWVKFAAEANAVYTFTTSAWGERSDTLLTLFDTDGQTVLASNDDYEGATDGSSRIVWQAPQDGTYFVLTTNQDGLTECETEYDLWMEYRQPVTHTLYLPLLFGTHNHAIHSSLDMPHRYAVLPRLGAMKL